ncbi:MAG: hypothetical protein KKE51_05750 [Gammaproteobacteria bacterium]|nr:hypothetical protein [Gammaproteobacteria bacterium]MBU2435728.1 hypothetical protein [Gammaproteobacteria bacterium]MBU2449491.1 hypothetical protein [Gammaproteobacteria bacterium]
MYRPLLLLLLTLLVAGICFGIGIYLAKLMARKKRARRKLPAHSLPMSAFSTLDHPAAQQSSDASDDTSPLDEAEIFMTYGKKAKAIEILREALGQKRISQEEYDAFKVRHEIQ